ncbi:MAG: SHOCT domain-containing protein [Candidatus Bathyarchaeia archaeon]|jgi:rubrerythrin
MDENMETMKRRLEFLINERQQKQAELEQLAKSSKKTGVSGVLHAMLGDGVETHMLEMQQMKARAADLNSQIRSLDFEINTLRSALSSSSSAVVPSRTRRFTCPNCGVSRDIPYNSEGYANISKSKAGICKTCYKPFKVNVDEKTDTWLFESLRENPTFYIHSPSLNADLAYTELLMPDNARENLLNIAKQLEKGDEAGARGELENIYTTYPVQVWTILFNKGLHRFVMPFTVGCQRCGVGIPRERLGNCPICKDAVVQKKTAEDPMQILKLRLAKGEISKEEYEDLKKSVES